MDDYKTFNELVPGDTVYVECGGKFVPLIFVSLEILKGKYFKLHYKKNNEYSAEKCVKISKVYLNKSASFSFSTYDDFSALEEMDFNYKIFTMHIENIRFRKNMS